MNKNIVFFTMRGTFILNKDVKTTAFLSLSILFPVMGERKYLKRNITKNRYKE